MLDVTPDKSGLIPALSGRAPNWSVKELFGRCSPLGTCPLGKLAKQSSRAIWRAAFSTLAADLAVDGDKNTFASTDDGDSNPWWMVDLGKTTVIGEVSLYNRRGRQLRTRSGDITLENTWGVDDDANSS